jgi:RNA polymerase sigma-70 factor (ECF subfamily)
VEPIAAGERPLSVSNSDLARFEAAFERHHRTVLAYALRRVSTDADAEDAVAETFAVAWRRSDRMPDPDLALPWLFAIARRILANQHRGATRRLQLGLRLRARAHEAIVVHPAATPALEALARLRPDERELLRLLVWDGLSQAETGAVLGISANAVAIRLHRARRRLAEELARVKGFDAGRTSGLVEGKTTGRRRNEEQAP